MNNKISILLVLFLLSLLSSCKKDVIDNEYYCDDKLDLLNSYMNMPRPADSYNYPVRPCMNKWKGLNSTDDKIKACVIPIKILKEMTTQAVIQALWEYPFFWEPVSEIGTRNIQKDFETVFYSNNAYNELLSRKDAGVQLLKRCELIDPISREKMFHPLALELLISQPNFLEQLTADEKKKLVAIAIKNDKIRIASGISGELGRYPTLMLIGRAMIEAAYAPFVTKVKGNTPLKRFIDTSMFFVKTMEEVTALKQLIIDDGKDFIN